MAHELLQHFRKKNAKLKQQTIIIMEKNKQKWRENFTETGGGGKAEILNRAGIKWK